MKYTSILFALVGSALFVACSPAASNDADAGDASIIQDTGTDTVTDTNVADTSVALYTACAANADCGPMGVCLTNYPGGLCSKRCSTDSACAGGHCVMNQCLPACTEGGGQCSPSQVCDTPDPTVPDVSACFPACSLDTDAPACNAHLSCNLYDGAGQCTATPAPTTGGNDGDPCMSDTDCKGVCVNEIDDAGMPTGYPNGFCISFGRTPPDAMYAPGQPLPRGNCPMGDVAIPAGQNASDGDLAYCQPSCMVHSDCRAGYGCFFFEDMAGTRTSTGYCDAINCMAADFAAMPNNNCPTGFFCESQPTDGATPEGTCIRGTPDGGVSDGGASDAGDAAATTDASDDASVDATVTDGTAG